MMFSCLPVSNEHECCIAHHFVGQYNERNGTDYRVVAFPEIDNRNTKEPEVLLEDPQGGPRLAIERKSVVYPLDEHYLGQVPERTLFPRSFHRAIETSQLRLLEHVVPIGGL